MIQLPLDSPIRLSYNEHGLVVLDKPQGYRERLEDLYFTCWEYAVFYPSPYAQIRLAKIALKINNTYQQNLKIRAKMRILLEAKIERFQTEISKNNASKDTKKDPDTTAFTYPNFDKKILRKPKRKLNDKGANG